MNQSKTALEVAGESAASALSSAIDVASDAFDVADAAALSLTLKKYRGLRYPARAELTDARGVLAALRTAVSTYGSKWSDTQKAVVVWREAHEVVAGLLDRHARYVLELVSLTPTTALLVASDYDPPDPDTVDADERFAYDATLHTALTARADEAAGSSAPAAALAALEGYRTSFDASWSSRPTAADASAEATSLTAAITNATATTAYLTWAAAHPA